MKFLLSLLAFSFPLCAAGTTPPGSKIVTKANNNANIITKANADAKIITKANSNAEIVTKASLDAEILTKANFDATIKGDLFCERDEDIDLTSFVDLTDAHVFIPYLVYFKLYSKDNPVSPEIRVFKGKSLSFKTYKPNKKTVFVIPGYYENSRYRVEQYFKALREGLLADPEYLNIIEVDWLDTVFWKNQTIYHALSHADFAGKHIARAITDLRKASKACKDENAEACKGEPYFFLIAHELGTIAAASAGYELKNEKIDRIMGLSPFKSFEGDDSKSLSARSAKLVEVIYTSLCSLPIYRMHRSFFVNSGLHPQPHCGPDIFGHCSVKEAYKLYVKSMRDDTQGEAVLCTHYRDYRRGNCREFPRLKLYNNKTKEEAVNGRYYLTTKGTYHKIPFLLDERY